MQLLAIYSLTSCGKGLASIWPSNFLSIIFILNSKSGWSIVRPQLNLVLSLSSSSFKSSGDLSDEIIICLLFPYKSLNVLKNSCWVWLALPKYWISSIINTSILRYLFLNISTLSKLFPSLFFLFIPIKSDTNFSLVTYKTFLLLFFTI